MNLTPSTTNATPTDRTPPPPQMPSPTSVRGILGQFLPHFNVPVRSSEAESIVRELFALAGITIGGTEPGDIVVHDPRFYERLLRDASVGLGESYMDGWWETDALDVMIDKVMRANLKQKVTGSWRLRALTVKAVLFNLQSKARSGASVEAHYDIGKVEYKNKNAGKEPVSAPQKKTEIKDPNEPATEPQLKAINTILGKLGITDDLERHKKVSVIIGLPEAEVLTTLSKLKKGQASKIIETLTAEGTK